MEQKLNYYIDALVAYGLRTQLLAGETDAIYARNRLLQKFQVDDYTAPFLSAEETAEMQNMPLYDILQGLLLEADIRGLIDATSVQESDLFDSELMDCLLPRPSEVEREFFALAEKDKESATTYFYDLSKAGDYIRTYRVVKDLKWQTETTYGNLDITVNLSKPEKDPRAIAAAKLQKSVSYPLCMLCKEASGYHGRMNYPGRANHRIIPLQLAGEKWYLQYSPYVYYNEHCILLSGEHRPMCISRDTFQRLLDFVAFLPHYSIGSNADLPIVGGSILSHDHFQGGRYTFPMDTAKVQELLPVPAKYEGSALAIEYLKWPLPVIRVKGKDIAALVNLAVDILGIWRAYSDEENTVLAYTPNEAGEMEAHNTITPVARQREQVYELDLILRNNLTSAEHPLGIYHPHQDKHHIKKENIGLIEAMGLAVLPARLQTELQALQQELAVNRTGADKEHLQIHAAWAADLLAKYGAKAFKDAKGWDILQYEVGQVFKAVLEDAGVFKQDAEGRKAFKRFWDTVLTELA